jgi:hypothetical protein
MKISTACLQCRTGKRKCSSTKLGASCTPCINKNISCSNQAHRRQNPSISYTVSTRPCDNIRPPYSEDIIYLVNLYFEYIHDKPHTLFHVPSFKASLLDGTVSRTVLLSMIGLSARWLRYSTTQI